MPRALLLCLTIVPVFQLHLAAAGAVTEDVPVPGGTAAMARSVGLNAWPERARFVAELARLTYPAAEGINTTRAKAASALRRRPQAQPPPEATSETVPIPLTVPVWSRAVFHRTIAPEDIVAAIISDPRAAHLCYGLAGSDDQTLEFFIEHQGLITWMYKNGAASFAAFGSSLHIRENRVLPPGTPAADSLWEAVVGERLDRPEAFVRSLFALDQGRLAYLYDTIANLDPPRRAFALGLWMKDRSKQLNRFKSLVATNQSAFAQWQPAKFPFSRPPYDIAAMLARVQVRPDGSPAFPAMQSAWEWAFEGFDVPAEPSRVPIHVASDELIDAALLAQAITSDDPEVRNDRLDQIAFAQRAFAASDAGALSDIFFAVRAFPRYRMLMLALERMGLRHASAYTVAVRRAQQLSALDSRRAFNAFGQFQGALGLVGRMVGVRTLDAAASEGLVVSLSNIPLNDDNRYGAGVASWLSGELRMAVSSASGRRQIETRPVAVEQGNTDPRSSDMERTLTIALSGVRADKTSSTQRVPWEGQTYRLDLPAAEEQRLQRIRDKQGGSSLDLAVAIASVVKKLTGARVALEDVSAASADLKKIAADLAPLGSERSAHREAIQRAAEDLSKITSQSDAQKAGHLASALGEAADDLLTDALMNWVYAVSIADADSPVLLTDHITRRHDFGRTPSPRRLRMSAEWAVPRQQTAAGVPWHVAGSLLGLDVALSSLALRRIDGDRVVDVPSLSTNEREAFAEAFALLDPLALRDGDRDVIADAIARGRERVRAVAGNNSSAVDLLMAEINMDGWRRRALRWTIVHEPARVDLMFSLTELLYLGGASNVDLHAWGMGAMASAGCLCTVLAPPNQWRTLLGRPQFGLLAATVPDLNLHIAMMLRELRLPAPVAKAVLSAAVQDFIDETRPTDANDWLTLVRSARMVPRERIEDYVAVATASGPLMQDEAGAAETQER